MMITHYQEDVYNGPDDWGTNKELLFLFLMLFLLIVMVMMMMMVMVVMMITHYEEDVHNGPDDGGTNKQAQDQRDHWTQKNFVMKQLH